MRLIDANTFKMEDFRHCLDCDSIIQVIKHSPTIDAVLVCRCKDCKHRDPENHHCDHPAGTTIYFPRKDDDFCSYGERKGGEG